MPVCDCLIEATKGNQTRYYHATVEEDGFVYFNDAVFYRVETPQNLVQDIENEQVVTITGGVQYWYVVRDIWVYANRFDQLELSMPPQFDKNAVEFQLNELNDRINEIGDHAFATNGQSLLDLWRSVDQIAVDLINQGTSVTRPTSITAYNTWTDYPPISL